MPTTTTFSTTTPRGDIKVGIKQNVTFEEYTDNTTGITTFTFTVPDDYDSTSDLTYIANTAGTASNLTDVNFSPNNYWVLKSDNSYQLDIRTETTTTFSTTTPTSDISVSTKQGMSPPTLATSGSTNTYTFTVPETYDGTDSDAGLTYIRNKKSYTELSKVFPNPRTWWNQQPDKSYQLTVGNAQTISTKSGSLDIIIKNSKNKDVGTFNIISGKLDTKKSSNGDYADVCIPIIFNILNNGYIYPDSIFDNIRDTLAAFFPSIGLEQNIVDATLLLVNEFVSGKITIEQFNVLLKIEYKRLADNFGNEYFENYVKLQVAIDKYKYLLTNRKFFQGKK